MKKKFLWALLVTLATGAFVWSAGTASAQAITSDPIAVPAGETGCGGNTQIRDVTTTFVCANQRTFHFGAITRTVVARSTFGPDGSASTTFTLTGGVAPVDLKLRIVPHEGLSGDAGPTLPEATGVIPKGTAGPVTLSYRFDCGQIDIKAVLVGNGDSIGRISGPYLCISVPVTTTVPTTAPTTTVAGATTTAVVSPSSTAQTQVVGRIPDTGWNGYWTVLVALIALTGGGLAVWMVRQA